MRGVQLAKQVLYRWEDLSLDAANLSNQCPDVGDCSSENFGTSEFLLLVSSTNSFDITLTAER